jgi:hypothetical protein
VWPPPAGSSRSKVPGTATIVRIYMKLYRLCSVSALALTYSLVRELHSPIRGAFGWRRMARECA